MKERQSQAVQNIDQIEAALQVGLQVIVQKEVGQERTWAKVAGWVPEATIILDGPAHWVGMGQLFSQNRLVVRFISLGNFYGFTAKVLAVLKSPVLVMLEWPRMLDRLPLSSETRCMVNTHVLIEPSNRDGGYGKPSEALLTDISKGGCQAKAKRQALEPNEFQAGLLVRLKVALPNSDKRYEVLAQVRNTQISGSEVVMGLRFEQGQAQAVGRLQLMLAPMLCMIGENPDDRDASTPAVPSAPELVLDKAPLTAPQQPTHENAPEKPEPWEVPLVLEVPEHLRVDTTANKLPLEDMTAERVAAILGVRAIGGTAVAVMQARALVRAWVEKFGEVSVRQRRRLLVSECSAIEGLRLIN